MIEDKLDGNGNAIVEEDGLASEVPNMCEQHLLGREVVEVEVGGVVGEVFYRRGFSQNRC